MTRAPLAKENEVSVIECNPITNIQLAQRFA